MSTVKTQPSSVESLRRLIEGNIRFTRGLRSIESMQGAQRLREMAGKGQSPFAILLTCSDSRIPTEILFDRGVGDLFVIRSAGNRVDTSALASIEFAAASFDTPLCVVMGHTECGAIDAAQKYQRGEQKLLTPSLERLLRDIEPDTITNVERGVRRLRKRSGLIHERIESGRLMIVGACVDLATGMVTFELPAAVKEKLA